MSLFLTVFLNSRLSMMSARAGILDAVSLGKQLFKPRSPKHLTFTCLQAATNQKKAGFNKGNRLTSVNIFRTSWLAVFSAGFSSVKRNISDTLSICITHPAGHYLIVVLEILSWQFREDWKIWVCPTCWKLQTLLQNSSGDNFHSLIDYLCFVLEHQLLTSQS